MYYFWDLQITAGEINLSQFIFHLISALPIDVLIDWACCCWRHWDLFSLMEALNVWFREAGVLLGQLGTEITTVHSGAYCGLIASIAITSESCACCFSAVTALTQGYPQSTLGVDLVCVYNSEAEVWPLLSSELISKASREEIAYDYAAKAANRLRSGAENKQCCTYLIFSKHYCLIMNLLEAESS